jgi:hypothetical protein
LGSSRIRKSQGVWSLTRLEPYRFFPKSYLFFVVWLRERCVSDRAVVSSTPLEAVAWDTGSANRMAKSVSTVDSECSIREVKRVVNDHTRTAV